MTPSERKALATAMETASGEPWIINAVAPYGSTPCVEGVTRQRGDSFHRVSILRIGEEGWLVTGQFGRYRHRFPGRFVGRGWIARFVPVAMAMIDTFDAGLLDYVFPAELNDKFARRQEHYRRLLRPDSGATDNERAIAMRRLRS